eukprot:2231387-Rhodomonas_salina.1
MAEARRMRVRPSRMAEGERTGKRKKAGATQTTEGSGCRAASSALTRWALACGVCARAGIARSRSVRSGGVRPSRSQPRCSS